MATIIIAGSPAWAAEISALLRENDADPRQYVERSGYVTRLADDRAALILVDGTDDQWRFWTTTPKTSPATRRVPVVLITDDADQRDAALRSGANVVVAPDELIDELPLLLTELARIPAPETLAELDRQCDQPLPPEALEAVNKFNHRRILQAARSVRGVVDAGSRTCPRPVPGGAASRDRLFPDHARQRTRGAQDAAAQRAVVGAAAGRPVRGSTSPSYAPTPPESAPN